MWKTWVRSGKARFIIPAAALASALALGILVQSNLPRPTEQIRRADPPRPSPQGPCSPDSALAFVSTRSGREQIYALQVGRPGSTRRITRLPGFTSDPAWSPDGRRIAFRWFRRGADAPHLYVVNADGSDLRLLVKEAAMPAWSPNGSLIAYANLHAGSRGISVVDVQKALQGMDAIQIVTRTGDAIPEELPAWSPDGRRLAFTSQRDGTSDIWTVNLDGTELENLTPEPSLESGATWSPDGTFIAFGSNRDSSSALGGRIFAMRANGSDAHPITFKGDGYAPDWSPNGCWIAFNSQRSGNSEIYMMRSDGSGVRQLTTTRSEGGEPAAACCAAWRPEKSQQSAAQR